MKTNLFNRVSSVFKPSKCPLHLVDLEVERSQHERRIEQLLNEKEEKERKETEELTVEIPIPPAFLKKEYSGQFNVRVPKDLHKALCLEAAHREISLNALVLKKLIRTTASPDIDYLRVIT